MGTARRPGQDRDHPRPKPFVFRAPPPSAVATSPRPSSVASVMIHCLELFFIHAIELARMLMLMLMHTAPLLPPPVLEPENAGGGIRWYMLAVRRVHAPALKLGGELVESRISLRHALNVTGQRRGGRLSLPRGSLAAGIIDRSRRKIALHGKTKAYLAG